MNLETLCNRTGWASILAAGIVLTLAGCASKVVTPKVVVDTMDGLNRLQEIEEEERERDERRRRLATDLSNSRPIGCYVSDVRIPRVPAEVFRHYESTAPKSTTEIWNRHYGSGGGGGDGGGGC